MAQTVSLDRPQHFRLGFILDLRQGLIDLIWLLGLPLLAIAVAFACQRPIYCLAIGQDGIAGGVGAVETVRLTK